jgi:hypothetical protein
VLIHMPVYIDACLRNITPAYKLVTMLT